MIKSIFDQNVAESTAQLKKNIKKFLEGKDHGMVRGYLVMDESRSLLQKKDLKTASSIDENGAPLSCHGSVTCGEPNERIRCWVPVLIIYTVKNNLIKEFESYSFEKFEISIDFFPEYVDRKNKMFRYKKTGMILPYLKIYLKW